MCVRVQYVYATAHIRKRSHIERLRCLHYYYNIIIIVFIIKMYYYIMDTRGWYVTYCDFITLRRYIGRTGDCCFSEKMTMIE